MDTVVATLNKLLETTKDGESGFRTCAGAVKNTDLKTVFEGAARRCDEGAAELQAKIRSLGTEPASSGTARGARHRAWTNIKSSDHWHGRLPGMDEYGALMEELPADVKAIVQRQYEVVKADRDRIRNLRDLAFLGMVGWA
jgi:Domain of unknown function (DUF2383)